VTPFVASDIYRLTVTTEADGWTARPLNGLTAVPAGGTDTITLRLSRTPDAAPVATFTVTATSESDPSVTASIQVRASR
jgi:hypothetical protein